MSLYEEITVTLEDSYEAYARYWPAQGRSQRGAILYHHGIQSHCGWYESSAKILAQAGYAVLQVDRRGSGRNPTQRGHAASADQLIEDAHVARNDLLNLSGAQAYHVIGVSWGGKLATAAYVDDPENVASLSLVTPGLFPLVGVSKVEMSRIAMAMIYEREQTFRIPLDDPALFTIDPTWQQYIATDDLTLRHCSAGFYLASRRMDKTCAKLPQAPPVPCHLFLAGDERIIDNDKTESFFNKLDWPQCRITIYEKARHSLEFESHNQAYFAALLDFISQASAPIP